MKKLFFIFVFFTSAITLFAQHETDERVIGFKYKLNFTDNSPQVITQGSDLYDPNNSNYKGEWQTPRANSVCDTSGNLIFYYDGAALYQSDGQTMQDGELHEYNFSSYYTTSLIVPIEENNRRYYYLFETLPNAQQWDYIQNIPVDCLPSESCPEFRDLCTLTYHIIDMHGNGSKGAVIKKNIFVADSVAPSISGIKHQNNIDTWVSVLEYRTNKILNFKVNACGIHDPVINAIPDFEYKNTPVYMPYNSRYGTGYQLVYSTKGDYAAFPGSKISATDSLLYTSLHLFVVPFNNQTGLFDFSILKTIPLMSGIYANLFSHDSKYLYYHYSRFHISKIWIYQYDLNSGVSIPVYYNNIPVDNNYTGTDYGKNNDILIFKININQTRTASYLGKIKNIDQPFVTDNLIDSLPSSVMNQPKYLSAFSYIARNNYIYNFYHPGYKKPAAFPVAKSLFNTVASPSCFNNPVSLKGTTNIPVDSLYWLVKKSDDNQWQRFDTDTFGLPVNPGTYTAHLVSYKYCLADTTTQQFTIEAYPVVQLAYDTLYTCESKALELPGNDVYTYHWYNAQRDVVSKQVTETGQYNMVVQNSCGTKADSLYVKNSTVNVTNLITANNDNQNDCLFAGSNNKQEILKMSIYNSWGSRIFYDNSYSNNWCPGNETSSGIYYYEVIYNRNCSKKGWIEVIR